MGRYRRLCRRSRAGVSVAVVPHDGFDLRGSRRASFPRAGLPPWMQSEGSFHRKTAAVDHHHPLRPPCPAWFSRLQRPFFAGAKLPSRNDSLHFNCWRSFNSLKKVRQIFGQTPCSSQSRSRRQQVEGWVYFSGRSCQRAPLRRIHKMPCNTRRLAIQGRPALRCWGAFGSKGAIFCYCALVSNGRDRAIGPPSALLILLPPALASPPTPRHRQGTCTSNFCSRTIPNL